MSQILTVDYESNNLGELFTSSLKNTGFAVIKNHPISQNLIDEIYDEWKLFFNSKYKHDYLYHQVKQDGYFPYRCENAKGYSIKDLKEFYHYYEWGVYPKNISNTTISLYHELLKIGEILLRWIETNAPDKVSSNFSIPLSQMINGSKLNLLRIIHYPPLDSIIEDGAVRAAPHEDINLITLLVTGSQPGLQVQNNDGEWVDLECNPGWIVINTGDMLSECSQGYFPSTSHRVINPIGAKGNIPRYTMPLFIHPRDDVQLSNKYTARGFLNERLNEIGLKKADSQ